MSTPQDITIEDFCRAPGQLVELDVEKLPKLPHPYEDWQDEAMPPPPESQSDIATNLDGTTVVRIKENRERASQQMGQEFAAIFEAHQLIASDASLTDPVEEIVFVCEDMKVS